jgi:hypothetical protein
MMNWVAASMSNARYGPPSRIASSWPKYRCWVGIRNYHISMHRFCCFSVIGENRFFQYMSETMVHVSRR